MRRFARTIARWQAEVLAYFTTGGASNGPTEAVNLLIKTLQRCRWVLDLAAQVLR